MHSNRTATRALRIVPAALAFAGMLHAAADAQEIADKAAKAAIVTDARDLLFGSRKLPANGFRCTLYSESFNLLRTGKKKGHDGADSTGTPLGFALSFRDVAAYCRPEMASLQVIDGDGIKRQAATVVVYSEMALTCILTLDDLAFPKGSEAYRVTAVGDEYRIDFTSSGKQIVTMLSSDLTITKITLTTQDRRQIVIQPFFKSTPAGLAVESVTVDVTKGATSGSVTIDVKHTLVAGYPLPSSITIAGADALLDDRPLHDTAIDDRMVMSDYIFNER
jgi:hypothetical protein